MQLFDVKNYKYNSNKYLLRLYKYNLNDHLI